MEMNIFFSEALKIVSVLAVFVIFFLLMDRLEKKKRFNSELNRKILHIGTGICGILLPFLFEAKISVIILGIIFLIILTAIRVVKHKITGMREIIETSDRKTLGDIYFVISIMFLWVISKDNKVMYSLPLLILMFSDAFAALIGKFYARYRFDTGFGVKSLEGSAVFFLSTYFCCSNFFLIFTDLKNTNVVLLSLLLSILTMIIEVISWNGLDNLFIPFFVYLFIRLNFYRSTQELMYRVFVIAGLFAIVVLNRKKTTLTKPAQTASLFFMYLVAVLGGLEWLMPPLMMYLGYYHFTPKVEGQIKDSLKALLSIAFLGFFWIVLSTVMNKEIIFFVYIFVFSLYFGIINFIRYNAVFQKERNFRIRIFRKSVLKSATFFAINYIVLSGIKDMVLIVSALTLILAGILIFEIFIEKSHINIIRNSYGGENKVFLATIIVALCSLTLLGVSFL